MFELESRSGSSCCIESIGCILLDSWSKDKEVADELDEVDDERWLG